jgi:serine phosphatase RsbU (regulator of sigma subunit)/CHASE2 domain-containing sensor protein
MKLSLRTRVFPFLIPIAVTVVIYGFAIEFGWLSSIDEKTYDLAMRLRSGLTQPLDVIVVAIDQSSLDSVFPCPSFPLSRHLELHAEVVRKLDSAGAKLIAFDILFDRLTDVSDSAISEFASSLAAANKVILAASIERHTETDARGQVVAAKEILCKPTSLILSNSKGIALIDMPTDVDGAIRRCYYGKVFQGDTIHSIASSAENFGSSSSSRLHDNVGTFYIDYSLYADGIPSISYEDVLRKDGWQNRVRDKIALVGLTENEQIDMFKTPPSYSSGLTDSKLSGVEIHALSIATLLSGSQIHATNDASSIVIGAVILALLVLIVSRIRIILSVLLSLLIIVSIVLGGLILVAKYSLVFPVGEFTSAFILSVVGSYALSLGIQRRIARSMNRQLTDIRRDLDYAGSIQKNLQPTELPQNDRLDIGVDQRAYSEVGGDYYDIVQLTEGRIGLLVADVSGKGVPGSLIMANLQGRFRQIALDTDRPKDILSNLNKLVNEAAGSKTMFATLFYGILDTDSMLLKYANAGHCAPILCSKTGNTRIIEDGGLMIGPFPDMVWEDYEVALTDGDVLCLYTDGISETRGKDKKEMFGDDRVARCIREMHDKSADAIVKNICESCEAFASEDGFDDDWTLLAVRVNDRPHPKVSET